MQGELERFHAAGAEVVAVGQGTGEEAARFGRRFGAEFPCVGDPERKAYRALGLQRGTAWNVILAAFLRAPIATAREVAKVDLEGLRLSSTDGLQLGGVAIFDTTGELHRMQIAERPMDMATNEEMLRELARVTLGSK